jgi:DNA-3-methyladenine glycosylase I
MVHRCEWSLSTELMQEYHDKEWGVPVHDDLKHFEFLLLDAFQAGLSWSTVLNKRDNFRKAFAGFDPNQIILFDEDKYNKLLLDSGIIRNKLKIRAAINNAEKFIEVQKEFGSFDKYIWSFTDGKTINNKITSLGEIPAKTDVSDRMSKDLKKRGFKFVGSTICYSYMQAAGIVNDHLCSCFRYNEV